VPIGFWFSQCLAERNRSDFLDFEYFGWDIREADLRLSPSPGMLPVTAKRRFGAAAPYGADPTLRGA
jgi:hypothetical protein